MNTAKQVNMIIGLLFVGLVGTTLYYMFDSGVNIAGISFGNRQASANERQELTNVERGSFLFARYCRSCHGLTGQGAAERTGLPGAVLNASGNHPPELAASALTPKQQRFNGTITCGRVGTQMPPWLTDNNGPLNFYQIQQLVTLITSEFAPEGWEKMVEFGNEADAFLPAKFLTKDVGVDDTTITLNDASSLTKDSIIRIGLDTIDEPYELMIVSDFDTAAKTVTVKRGADAKTTTSDVAIGTDALAHKAGDEVYSMPFGLPPGSITGESGTPPCGQLPYTAPSASSVPVALASGGAITLGDNFFEIDSQRNPQIQIAAATAIDATINNTGTGIHNLRIAGPDGKYNTDDDIVSDPDTITAGKEASISINLAAGTYNYECEFHPDVMKGEITAQ